MKYLDKWYNAKQNCNISSELYDLMEVTLLKIRVSLELSLIISRDLGMDLIKTKSCITKGKKTKKIFISQDVCYRYCGHRSTVYTSLFSKSSKKRLPSQLDLTVFTCSPRGSIHRSSQKKCHKIL